MEFKISYFYKIREFTKDMLPISTALYDPRWYHAGLGQNQVFVDSRGVLNGVRFESLSSKFVHQKYRCPGKDACGYTPDNCHFIEDYYRYLKTLDFKSVQRAIIDATTHFRFMMKLEDMTPVLIVYESPSNPCSERGPLIRWFKENGVDLVEV